MSDLEQMLRDAKMGRHNAIKKAFEAGFIAAAQRCAMNPEECRQALFLAWKGYCGSDT